METTRSLFSLESSGWSVPIRPPADSTLRIDSGSSFQSEANRATERAGGRKAVAERLAETRGRRRAERRSGFERHSEKRLSKHGEARESGAGGPERPSDLVDASLTAGIGNAALPPADSSGVGLGGPGGPEAGPARSGFSGTPGNPPAPTPGGPLAAGLAVRVAGAPGPGAASPGAAAQRPGGAGGAAEAPAQTRMTRIDDPDPLRRKALWKAEQRARARQADRSAPRAAAILRQIKIHLFPGLRRANIDLEPSELGRLQIRLRLSGDRLEAHIRGESRETLDLIEKHLPELRSALATQGLEVSDFRLALGFGDSAETHDGGGDGPDRGDLSAPSRTVTRPPAVPTSHTSPISIDRVLGDTIDLYA